MARTIKYVGFEPADPDFFNRTVLRVLLDRYPEVSEGVLVQIKEVPEMNLYEVQWLADESPADEIVTEEELKAVPPRSMEEILADVQKNPGKYLEQ